ncbi:MAG: hypothetical protein QNJ82_07115 [Gammaproteobacteria bacterium]|nr:hypothetical protein [Gammaproteobacteria bacterium]
MIRESGLGDWVTRMEERAAVSEKGEDGTEDNESGFVNRESDE